jgi:hypothetical protein
VRKRSKLSDKKYKLKKRYGLTMEQHEKMHEIQDGKCAICNEDPYPKKLMVDHCHESSDVRGLLCNTCNLGIGFFKDNKELLQSAINYLNK